LIPARYAQIVFGLILSGLMSLLVSGISTLKALGPGPDLFAVWMGNWAFSWAVAFPSVLFVAPLTRRLVARIVAEPPQPEPAQDAPARERRAP
jgi:membrane protein implicated in regulation of membrane protease activity